jgi:hypothetical protein
VLSTKQYVYIITVYLLIRTGYRREDNIKMDVKEIGWDSMDLIDLS